MERALRAAVEASNGLHHLSIQWQAANVLATDVTIDMIDAWRRELQQNDPNLLVGATVEVELASLVTQLAWYNVAAGAQLAALAVEDQRRIQRGQKKVSARMIALRGNIGCPLGLREGGGDWPAFTATSDRVQRLTIKWHKCQVRAINRKIENEEILHRLYNQEFQRGYNQNLDVPKEKESVKKKIRLCHAKIAAHREDLVSIRAKLLGLTAGIGGGGGGPAGGNGDNGGSDSDDDEDDDNDQVVAEMKLQAVTLLEALRRCREEVPFIRRERHAYLTKCDEQVQVMLRMSRGATVLAANTTPAEARVLYGRAECLREGARRRRLLVDTMMRTMPVPPPDLPAIPASFP